MDKATILLPIITATGGPESLHNLAYNFIKNGIQTRIATNTRSQKILNYFKNYNPKYIPFSNFYEDESFIIIPETQTYLLQYLKKHHKAIWWLSSLNHKNSLGLRYKLRNYGIKSLLVKDQLREKLNSKNLYHFMQTNSSKNYLINNYNTSKNYILDLESPINEYYYKNPCELKSQQNNMVLINAAKHSTKELEFIKKYLKSNNYYLKIIKSKTKQEIISLYLEAKFYLDFGPHPGQERMPRESTMLGCYSIVGLRGTAKNYFDLPLPYQTKIECSNGISKRELLKAVHLMDEINAGKDLGHSIYKKYIEDQPKRFEKQLKKVIYKIKEI